MKRHKQEYMEQYKAIGIGSWKINTWWEMQLQTMGEEKNMFTFAWIGTDLNTFIWIKFLSH